MRLNWADIPGEFYAIAYTFAVAVLIANLSKRYDNKKTALIVGGFGAFLLVIMKVTHGLYGVIFGLLMLFYFAIMTITVKTACTYDLKTTLYFSVRAFIMGEFIASFGIQVYYYANLYFNLKLSWLSMYVFVIVVYVLTAAVFYLLEKRFAKRNVELKITKKELVSAALIGFTVFVTSNISYVMEALDYAEIVIEQLFTVRTMVNLGGSAILFAYHSQIIELNSRYEVMYLQHMLEMQSNNYEVLKQSVEVVNQKYHDLKYTIALLKDEANSEKSTEYLNKMEKDIKAYEANNKTGNDVLDTILTAKTLYCQNNGIELTCVADGEMLSFIDPMDLAVLFGNILDNAIESVSKITQEERKLIHMAVARQKGFARIRVENCYEEKPQIEGENFITSKSDKKYHGFGVKSIKNIVKKYGGSTTIQAENGWFEIRILIPISE
jgi:hypothetical protein